MSKIKGTVTSTGKGKFSFFVCVDSKDGFFFNTKFDPKCGKGDVVGIEYTQKDEKRGNISKLVVLEKNSSESAAGDNWDDDAPKATTPAAYKAPEGGNRQDSIVWQHSQEMGLIAAGLLLANGGFAVKGKADAARAQILALANELSYGYFQDALDPRKSAAFKESAQIEEDAKEPVAEDATEAEDGGDWAASEWED